MEIFIDSANLDEIRQAAESGVVDGVTTNPSLIAREGADFESTIREICRIVDGPVSAEVIATDYQGILEEARRIAALDERVVVKVPLIPEGVRAVATLSQEGIKTNLTLCFSVNQAIMAAKAGATYVSPFIGRLDDIGMDGVAVLEEIVEVFATYGFETKVLAASVRHPEHVRQAALVGADVVTIPFGVFRKLFSHPLTDQGLEKFLEDWHRARLEVKEGAGG